jgi:hypothetical protein
LTVTQNDFAKISELKIVHRNIAANNDCNVR